MIRVLFSNCNQYCLLDDDALDYLRSIEVSKFAIFLGAAATAYNEAAKTEYGDFAFQNTI